ncbi:MAG: hypothetical protein ACLTW7_16055 [Enterococcus sp.]
MFGLRIIEHAQNANNIYEIVGYGMTSGNRETAPSPDGEGN